MKRLVVLGKSRDGPSLSHWRGSLRDRWFAVSTARPTPDPMAGGELHTRPPNGLPGNSPKPAARNGHRAVYGELFTRRLRAMGICDRTLITAASGSLGRSFPS